MGRARKRKEIPDGLTTISISEYFKVGDRYSDNLRLKRKEDSPNFTAQFLPPIEDDPRPNKGRSKSGKRLLFEKRLSTPIIIDAVDEAVKWNQEQLEKNINLIQTGQIDSENSAEKYFNLWFEEENKKRENDISRDYEKWKRDTLSNWERDFGNRSWCKKSITNVTKNELDQLVTEIEIRNQTGIDNTSGSGAKDSARTLWNKIVEKAERENHNHNFPSFPKYKKDITPEVEYLTIEQWEKLLEKVIELSNGNAMKDLKPDEYKNLPDTFIQIRSIRNWVDLYDALMLQWFFYLRPQDLDILLVEEFELDGNEVTLRIGKTKTGNTRDTYSWRSEGADVWKRIYKRRQNDLHVNCPSIDRQGKKTNKVRKRLNELLKYAISEAVPEFKRDKNWKMIRHTAFRATLKENKHLRQGQDLEQFAINAHTSITMLNTRYLKPIKNEETAAKSRKAIPRGRKDLYLIKRAYE